MFRIGLIFDLLRVKQWVKNIFIFFPLFFSEGVFNTSLLANTVIAFMGFCFVSSGMYIVNDCLDRGRDKHHPRKSQRPIAKGEISVRVAGIFVVLLLLAGLSICAFVNRHVLSFAVIYILMHAVYNFFVKKIVILDVVFVALGFQIRIWVGSAAIGVYPSVWLQLCVFLLALFLGFTKRRYELASLKDSAIQHRDVLAEYTIYLLDQIIIICSTLAIVFYGLYTIAPEVTLRIHGTRMAYTVPFVIFGMFRYLYLIHVKKQGGDPGELLAMDTPLLWNVILWILATGVLIYKPF